MRTNRQLIMGMALACLLASCKKENNNENKDATYFKASIEQGNGDSKTFLDPVGDVGNVKWSAGDQFKIAECTGSTTATFTLVEGEEGKEQGAEFICHGFDLEPSYTAAYPAANVSGISNGTVTFDLPATQNITATGTFGNGVSPMVATGDGPELSFKNVCGGLGFPLKGVGTHVTGLRLTSNKATDKLWGMFTVADCTDADPTLAYSTEGSNVLEIACDVDLTNEAQWFYFILPPATLTEGFTIEVLNGDAVVHTQSTANNPNMVRNVIRGISSEIEIEHIPEGAIRGGFSVSETLRVYFSQGNLQYQASTSTWRFAENQWDYVGTQTPYIGIPGGTVIGSDNADISSTYSGWIDLFGWGTSGYHNENDVYNTNYYPYSTPRITINEELNYHGYGPSTNMEDPSLVGTSAKYDWGVYNDIHVGEVTIPAGTYRTLTDAEWRYLRDDRDNAAFLFANGNVSDVNGCILLPDNWVLPDGLSFTPGVCDYSLNVYTPEQWSQMEASGAVFLPAAGDRLETWVNNYEDSIGSYWSSTYRDSFTSFNMCFTIIDCVRFGDSSRNNGFSVRLVVDAN